MTEGQATSRHHTSSSYLLGCIAAHYSCSILAMFHIFPIGTGVRREHLLASHNCCHHANPMGYIKQLFTKTSQGLFNSHQPRPSGQWWGVGGSSPATFYQPTSSPSQEVSILISVRCWLVPHWGECREPNSRWHQSQRQEGPAKSRAVPILLPAVLYMAAWRLRGKRKLTGSPALWIGWTSEGRQVGAS